MSDNLQLLLMAHKKLKLQRYSKYSSEQNQEHTTVHTCCVPNFIVGTGTAVVKKVCSHRAYFLTGRRHVMINIK